MKACGNLDSKMAQALIDGRMVRWILACTVQIIVSAKVSDGARIAGEPFD
jgi:hypothetical protein